MDKEKLVNYIKQLNSLAPHLVSDEEVKDAEAFEGSSKEALELLQDLLSRHTKKEK